MIRVRDLRRLSRGLRFRLTAVYALFFAILLVGITAAFHERLAASLDTEAHSVLDQRWAAMKGYLRIEPNDEGRVLAIWYYDDKDPEESRIVLGVKSVYLVADSTGALLPDLEGQPSVSRTYEDLGLDAPAAIHDIVRRALSSSKPAGAAFWSTRRSHEGVEYLVRSGIVFSEGVFAGGRRFPYYASLGYSLAANNRTLREFSLVYVAVIPGSLILGSLIGWIMAGRALAPVRAAAQTAQRISGSNLSLRIPTRDAGDELDYLILTFNRMIDRLEASFQQMKQFSADVSHELRTPITAIRGQLEVALFTAQTTEQYREAMFNALQDTDRLSQLVRALLLLSQAESGQLALQKSRIDLAEIARDLVEEFQIPAEAASVTLSAHIPPTCPAEVDRVQIERLISNLLSNALKFTPEGGRVTLRLRSVAPEPDGGATAREQIELVVEDTGRGISAEHLPHIFDRFYRVAGPGGAPAAEQGLGLGLSFVAWIVKAHHGTIEVVSAPGEGARFIVRLPAPGVGSDTMELARPVSQT